MLLAIVGTRYSGKSEVQNYYASVHDFVVVHIDRNHLLDSGFDIFGASSPSPIGDDGIVPASNSDVLLMEAAPTSHPNPSFSGQALYFPSAPELLKYATMNWRQNFVTTDLRTRDLVKMFVRRPFFMLVSVDAPLSTRFLRSGE
ncbi:hypothetical protein D9615_001284 [Tricholomella constricta]|uniref:Uncharacterized protein n=1 Tax=Tricholomella constricta TaxID=117010 RepID=A0A8H5M978_9AGAR|nr:hypothetical protein D9615_001284 [Tricholomella constricta]